jgi:hypothetical protein
MLQTWDKGLMGTTLRYPYEVRDAKEYVEDIPNVKLESDLLKLAEHILKSKAAEFDPAVRRSLRGSRGRDAQEETGGDAHIARTCRGAAT